jgi:hypothetical protein
MAVCEAIKYVINYLYSYQSNQKPVKVKNDTLLFFFEISCP